MAVCSFAGKNWKEVALFALGCATVVWSSFAVAYACVLVFAGLAWTRGDVRTAHITAPLVIASFGMLSAGVLSCGPGAGVCSCCHVSTKKRRDALASALLLRMLPIAAIVYVIAWVAIANASDSGPSNPPSPPMLPGGGLPGVGAGPWPPQGPAPPSWPPQPPFAPYEPSTVTGFLDLAAWLSFAVLIVAPVFELLVVLELNKELASSSSSAGFPATTESKSVGDAA